MTERDLRHWHKTGDEPSQLIPAPDCCQAAHNRVLETVAFDERRIADAAVHAERIRVVTRSLDTIETYRAAAASVLDPASVALLDKVAAECAKAIRKVGCICPRLAIGTFDDPDRTILGRDHRCGMHDKQGPQ